MPFSHPFVLFKRHDNPNFSFQIVRAMIQQKIDRFIRCKKNLPKFKQLIYSGRFDTLKVPGNG